ncbi:hypothetical protein LTR94_037194, partial [Friedmanniomyces endolithicus]
MDAVIGDNAAAIEQEASTRAQEDGLIVAAAGRTVAAVRNADVSAAKAAEEALQSLLLGDAAGQAVKASIAAAREEITVKIN